MNLRLGVFTPVVVGWPGWTADWEDDAGIEQITRVAKLADQLGYDHLTCSEHVGVPGNADSTMLGSRRGTRYWDALATLSYLAGQTERIRLATNVLVLGYHHPLAIAKRYGTLDQISGGRLILGLGVGSLQAEFETLGASFADRGARADDSLRALRVALASRVPSYQGEYYSFEGLAIEPNALQHRVPIWIGGNSRRALRRAVELGDGWAPGPIDPDLLSDLLERFPDRRDDFDVIVYPKPLLDPVSDPQAAIATIARLRDAGATIVNVMFVHDSLEHYCEQLHAAAELVKSMQSAI